MDIIKRFQEISGQERFKGWPLVGSYELGAKIPFFGQELKYTLRTSNGDEEYYSLR